MLGLDFLEFLWTDAGAQPKDMGGANQKALAAGERVITFFVVYGDCGKH